MPRIVNHLVPDHAYTCKFPIAYLEVRGDAASGEAHIVAITEGGTPVHGPQERFAPIAQHGLADFGDTHEPWSFSFTDRQIAGIENAVAPIVARFPEDFRVNSDLQSDQDLRSEMQKAFAAAVEANAAIESSPNLGLCP